LASCIDRDDRIAKRADADKHGLDLVDADADAGGDADAHTERAFDDRDSAGDGTPLLREYDWGSKVKIIAYAFSGAAVYVSLRPTPKGSHEKL
jgi:hypothetical protein